MSDQIRIRRDGVAGRITLTRPKALNALSYDMAMAIDAALIDWAADDAVQLVILDAEGEKAFCAGGDIQQLYDTGRAGDYDYGRNFWRDEYRLNARLAGYAKPIVSFMQGFVMGGGVGIGCHVKHRIVGESTRIAMPECGIGLVPDVGGSLLLAQAPGRMGAYLGLTAARMTGGDAIAMGFADLFVPEALWPGLIAELSRDGDLGPLVAKAQVVEAPLKAHQVEVDGLFAGTLSEIEARLAAADGAFAEGALKSIRRNSPLAMAVTLDMLAQLADITDIRDALKLEYRFTSRAMEQADFLEGIRAQIIDKDRNPQWKHKLADVPDGDVAQMIAPLGEAELTFGEDAT
ncbi:enoyl-CoA hydratase/isomerase family protein [Pseudooceanicola onchidii]|uniref:enoyl-CoA hydratase/isomerase family protein n=1 Tax=Pseudooceanicola onchidii TaxID=2562279 RepID=UPI0010A9E5AD|nr:enoyl-CoA hydratase/isomerase family protein [Pseudooceanicola onchidii]